MHAQLGILFLRARTVQGKIMSGSVVKRALAKLGERDVLAAGAGKG